MARTVPTTEEVAAELAALKGLVGRIRSRSAFGDDNDAKLAAEIEVIETNMPDGAIYDEFGGDDDDRIDSALGVRRWLDGEWDEGPDCTSPSASWKDLIVKETS